MKTLGQVAYEAYCDHCGGGWTPWRDLDDHTRAAWQIAADAILSVIHGSP